jgi:hypothetical protein
MSDRRKQMGTWQFPFSVTQLESSPRRHEVSVLSPRTPILVNCLYSVVKEINKINQLELDLGVSGASWHDEYKDSAYIFVGGIPFDLTEGDVITIFSQ